MDRKEDPNNKSIRQIVINSAGMDLVDRIDKEQDELLTPMMCLSDEDARKFTKTLEELLHSFREAGTRSNLGFNNSNTSAW